MLVLSAELRIDRVRLIPMFPYVGCEPLRLRQWDGYDPPPGSGKAANMGRTFPNQWHVEAASQTPMSKAFTVTVLRPYRTGSAPAGAVEAAGSGERMRLKIPAAGGDVEVAFHGAAEFATVRKGARTWRLR